MFLHDSWNLLSFVTGYLVGLVIIFAMRRFFPNPFYIYRLIAVAKLLYIFMEELVKSSIAIIIQITRPKLNIAPGISKMETPLRNEWEITILSCLITLTPGSVVLDANAQNGILYVHIMDIPESEKMVLEAKNRFEKAIMEVTR